MVNAKKKHNILTVHVMPALGERMKNIIPDDMAYKYSANSLEEASEYLAGMKFDLVIIEDIFAGKVLESAKQGILHYLVEQNIPYLFISDREYEHSLSINSTDQEFSDSILYLLDSKARETEMNEEKLKLLKALAVSINHEINNPLTIALLAVKKAKKGRDDDENLQEDLERIEKSLKNISITIQSLYRMNRIDMTEYRDNLKMVKIKKAS